MKQLISTVRKNKEQVGKKIKTCSILLVEPSVDPLVTMGILQICLVPLKDERLLKPVTVNEV